MFVFSADYSNLKFTPLTKITVNPLKKLNPPIWEGDKRMAEWHGASPPLPAPWP